MNIMNPFLIQVYFLEEERKVQGSYYYVTRGSQRRRSVSLRGGECRQNVTL